LIGHFNTDDLASYHAGTVSGGKAARISAHLSSCPQCADVHSGLTDVSQMLAGIRVPPMSETLTQRLQAAIADEATQRAAVKDGSPVLAPGRPDLPEGTNRSVRRLRVRAWSSSPLLLRSLAAAGVALLLVGGGILLTNQRGAAPSGARPSGLGAEPSPRAVKSQESGAAVGSASAITLRYRHGGEFVFANAVTSAVNYMRTDLATGIRHEVANMAQLTSPSVTMPAPSAAAEPRRSFSHTTVGQLESCLSTVAADRLVLLVEVAHYLGVPATIIVFRPVGNVFDVIVVGQTCGPASQDIITTLTVPTK
jgi:hypothetical protein